MASKRKAPGNRSATHKRLKTGVFCRFLLNKTQVGAVLGQSGANVKVIRSETKAYVSILWGKTAERVCEVNAPTVTSVVSAVGMIIDLMASLENEGQSLELRMLGQSANVGCLIGKGGSVISEAVREHKVRSIKVAKECIGISTEKLVSITGNATSVASAANWVINRLEEFPVREDVVTRDYKPSATLYQQAQEQSQAPFPSSVAMAPLHPSQLPPPPVGYQYVTAPTATPQAYSSIPSSIRAPASGPTTSMTINVPTQCVPGLIGKRGSVISAIKKRSGAYVSIKNAASANADNTGSRQVVISGTVEAVQKATQAIQDRLNILQASV